MRKWYMVLFGIGVLGMSPNSSARALLCECYDSRDGKVFCECIFSDGSPAVGLEFQVYGESGSVIREGRTNEFGELEFGEPNGRYKITVSAVSSEAEEYAEIYSDEIIY